MKLLPYMERTLSQYRDSSVQEFRFVLSEQITGTGIKSMTEEAAIQMQIHSRYRLERADQSRGMAGGMGGAL